jgi:hypothetical protein
MCNQLKNVSLATTALGIAPIGHCMSWVGWEHHMVLVANLLAFNVFNFINDWHCFMVNYVEIYHQKAKATLSQKYPLMTGYVY